ncbi:MAG: rhomboid family intramembrane serine protease [Candidatus Electrothrix aestuarii]|uniref:Rhomboid family intramembrane serine protease n=1 Tax=Candidatus Electrothrix aestuarii TaxID=3062594 RepID=A0AAU8LZ14_9BACT|nr:rhomboid family intramembrane serine protease [Candidatus Electrothrix aestuarii]
MKFDAAKIPVYLVCTIWAIYLLDLILPIRLNAYGIVPRTTGGLLGIPLTNFLHANLKHLISNTVPLFVLSLLLTLFYRKIFFDVIIIIIGCGGSLVWLFARSANHIGASMLIYGLAAFLISYGLLKRELVPVIISVLVALIYGLGMLGGMLPFHGFISWEGHLFGAVGGVVAARILRKR